MMKPTIRVAMVSHGYHPVIGGAEQQIRSLVPYLQQEQIDLSVITRRFPGLQSRESVDGVDVLRIPVPPPKPVASVSFSALGVNEIRSRKPQVLHAHGLFSTTTTAVIAKKLTGLPVIVKLMRGGVQGDIARMKEKWLGASRISYFGDVVDRFIVISQEIDRELENAGVPQDRRVFIPNGVDLERFRPPTNDEKSRLRASLEIDPEARVVVFTGRLAPEKRLDLLVDSWESVEKKVPGAQLVIVGDGPDREKLTEASEGRNVLYPGRTDDVSPYLRAADAFVLPSDTEGLSNALLEAMAAGLPVIATDVGGARDVIDHDRSGLIIPPGDRDALESALVRVLGNRSYGMELGTAARARIEEGYGLKSTARSLRQLYESVIDESRP
ncbi:MAG: glycosyltransferase family 4 protein [Thermomicrobiales bacterium]